MSSPFEMTPEPTFAGYTVAQLRAACAANPDDAHSKVILALLAECRRLEECRDFARLELREAQKAAGWLIEMRSR